MDTTTACEQVNGLALLPGVRCTARDHSHRFEDTIAVEVTFPDHPNTDAAEAPDYAGGPIAPRASYAIHVADCDCDELVGRVIDCVTDAYQHELREAVRYRRGDEWEAPFHPHRHRCIKRWSERTGRPVEADYSYGLV